MASLDTINALYTMNNNLRGLPGSMQQCSAGLRSLYAELSVGSSSSPAKQFKLLRDGIKRDALIYVSGIFPLYTQMVNFIKEFFEYYTLNLNDWKEMLPIILKEVNVYCQCCNEIDRLHNEIGISLTTKHHETTLLLNELNTLNKTMTNAKELDANGGDCNYSNSASSTHVSESVDSVLVIQHQCHIIEKVVRTTKDMMKSIAEVLNGVKTTRILFNCVKSEITSFIEEKDSGDNHYRVFNNLVHEMHNCCQQFYASYPVVRTDLQCIQSHPDDQNYIEEWLNEQQKERNDNMNKQILANSDAVLMK